jgi:aerobic-type carbon monoxide dehydrogenase small subunit (CoxS/CutS family)
MRNTARVTTLLVNGVERAVDVGPERSLLSVLREDLDLTGAKYGCGEAQCGACIVLVGDEPVPACVTPVGEAAGKPILTIEGLAGPDGRLHPLQQAFIDQEALQCGYCTPGMIMAALGLLRRQPDPSEEEIKAALQSNLCRCGTYLRIVRAVRQAALALAGTSPATEAQEPIQPHPGGQP